MKYIFYCIILVSTMNLSAQDWPNLKRFQTQNAEVLQQEKDEGRVVFMGNSITEGWSHFRPDFFVTNPFINRGISGQTTPQMLIRFRQDVVALNPEAVVILAGINDIAGNTGKSTIQMIADNIYGMAEIASANGIKVVLCSVLPAHDFPWAPGIEPADKVIDLNNRLKAYANTHHHIYVDYFSEMVDDRKGLPKAIAEDGIHPNKDGYMMMEPLVLEGIQKALK